MSQPNQAERLSKLEILFCEQEMTIEALNEVVTRQTLHLQNLEQQIDLLKQQLRELKKQIPDPQAIVDEKPPHY